MDGSTSLPYYRGGQRQRGRGIGALAAVLGRTAIPFVKKFIVPAAKRIGSDLIEAAAPEVADLLVGKKKLKTFAKDVGTKTIRKQLGNGKRKRKSKTRKVSRRKTSTQTSRSRSDFFKNIPE